MIKKYSIINNSSKSLVADPFNFGFARQATFRANENLLRQPTFKGSGIFKLDTSVSNGDSPKVSHLTDAITPMKIEDNLSIDSLSLASSYEESLSITEGPKTLQERY